MAVTRGTLAIARRLRRDIGSEADAAVRTLTGAWVASWDRLEPAWRQATADLVAEAGRLDHWPRPTDIARLPRVMAALEASETALDRLAERTRTETTAGADRVIDADAELEPRIIASQAPATEQEGLLAQVAGWLLVAEQDQTVIRTTVVTRIRTDAIQVIRRRAAGQITATTLPLGPAATAAMRRELIAGIDVGRNPREAARRMLAGLQARFNGGLTRAMNIARTEILDAYRTTSQQIHAANSDVVPGWTWLATLDLRTCPSCWGMHGTIHPVSEPGPDDHQQGRCARVPRLATWAELGIAAPEPPDLIPDAQARFFALSRSAQLRIMGPARLDLLESGRIGWGDLSTVRQNPGWRPSRVPTPVRNLQRQVAAGRPPTPGPAPAARVATPAPPPAAPAAPRRLTHDEAVDMQEAMLGDQPWTRQQITALSDYTGGGYLDANPVLRGQLSAAGMRPGAYDDALRMIDDATAGMRPLPEPVTTWRRVDRDAFGVDELDELTGLVGTVRQEQGFLSTSIRDDLYPELGDVYIEVRAPAGTPAAYVDPISQVQPGDPGVDQAERELLFAPGRNFRILEAVRSGDEVRMIIEILP